MLLSKKLNQTSESKVLRKLLVGLLVVVVEAVCEDLVHQDLFVADLFKDLVRKAML